MLRRRLLPLLLALVLVACGGGALVAGGEATRAPDTQEAGRVVRVVDGDTLQVQLGGTRERVRLIGVDTPESVKPGAPVECFGTAASAFTTRLLEGRRVRLTLDVEPRDRYGRLLAYVHRQPDGLFVNAELVRRGYATALTVPPDVRHAGRFRALQREARAAGRGLWSACR